MKMMNVSLEAGFATPGGPRACDFYRGRARSGFVSEIKVPGAESMTDQKAIEVLPVTWLAIARNPRTIPSGSSSMTISINIAAI